MVAAFLEMAKYCICCSLNRCWISGFGKSEFNGAYQTIQKEVDVPVLDSGKCQSLLRATRLGSGFVFDSTSFICAGGEQGKDACTVRSKPITHNKPM